MSVGAGAGAGVGVDTDVVVADPFDTNADVRVAVFSADDFCLGLAVGAKAITELGAPGGDTSSLCASPLATCDVEIGVLATSVAAGVRLNDGSDGHKTISMEKMTANAAVSIALTCHAEKRGSDSGT